MTREEAKKVFINRGYVNVKGGIIFDGNKWRQSVEVITEWLKEQSCDDAISRQAAIRLAEQGQVQGFEWQFKQLVDLPSVSTGKDTDA